MLEDRALLALQGPEAETCSPTLHRIAQRMRFMDVRSLVMLAMPAS